VIVSDPDGVSVTVGPNAAEAIVSDLTVGRSYAFTVIATNAWGTGPASSPSGSAIVLPSIPTLGAVLLGALLLGAGTRIFVRLRRR